MSIENSRTFTDSYGDTLEIGDVGGDDRIFFEVRIKNGRQLAFSREQSVEIAEKLLTGTARGKSPVTIFHEDGDERTSWNHTALESALAHGRVASFSYTKGDGDVIEQRHLKPTSIHEAHNYVIVTGFDPQRNDVRAFRLDRITGHVEVK